MKILVTGGAGYIGSFMTKNLLDKGFEVVVIDSVERGNTAAIDKKASFYQGKLEDTHFLSSVLSEHQIDAVIHFAGYISMGESMGKPHIYFENNTFTTLQLLEAMVKHKVKNIIFSSTAGVYGNPQAIPIPESHPLQPTNPYGESKRMVEQMLFWYQKIYSLNYVSLRYFNAAGAALDGSMGEAHTPETHIIANALGAILQNKEFTLYGTDYATPDGTCVRDYIHVLDLVKAHVLALEKLQKEEGGFLYNVGTGKGYSNKEVIAMIGKVTSQTLRVVEAPKRLGDAAELVADATKINSELGFIPEYSDLETIIKTAWLWHKNKVEK